MREAPRPQGGSAVEQIEKLWEFQQADMAADRFEREIQKNRVFILSAFPEFLLDYFGVKLWKTCVRHAVNLLEKQGCREE